MIAWFKTLTILIQEFFTESSVSFLKKSFSTAWNNIKRTPLVSFSSIFIIALVLVFFHSILSLQFLAQNTLSEINKKVDLIVEVKEPLDAAGVAPFIDSVKSTSGVLRVEYKDKQNALSDFLLRHPNIQVFFQKYQLKNPLPSSVEIVTETPNDLKRVIELVKNPQYASFIDQSKIESDTAQGERINKLLSVGDILESLRLSFLVIFVVVATLVIFNTVNVAVHHRKEDIYTMNLVGATRLFIELPFLFEGFLYSLLALFVGTMVNMILQYTVSELVLDSLDTSSTLTQIQVTLSQLWDLYPEHILLEGGLLLICSLLASFIAIEGYLRKHRF